MDIMHTFHRRERSMLSPEHCTALPVSVRLGTMTDVTIRIGLTGGIAAGKVRYPPICAILVRSSLIMTSWLVRWLPREARGCVESLILSVRMRWMSGAS